MTPTVLDQARLYMFGSRFTATGWRCGVIQSLQSQVRVPLTTGSQESLSVSHGSFSHPKMLDESPEEKETTFALLLEQLQKAQIVLVFRDGEVQAYIDNHEKNYRQCYRLPADRKRASYVTYRDYDKEQSRWTRDCGTTRLSFKTMAGKKLIQTWLHELPVQNDSDRYARLRRYENHGKGLQLMDYEF